MTTTNTEIKTSSQKKVITFGIHGDETLGNQGDEDDQRVVGAS